MKFLVLSLVFIFAPIILPAQVATIKMQPDSVYMVTNSIYFQIDRRYFFDYPTFQNSNSELGYIYTIFNGSRASIGTNSGSGAYRYFNLVSTAAGPTTVQLGLRDPSNIQSEKIVFNITVLPRTIDTLKSNQNKSFYTRGYPANKWALISLPINDLQLLPATIFKDLNNDYRIYSLNEKGKSLDVTKQDSLFFNLGSGYWFKTKGTEFKWNLTIPFNTTRRTDALKRFYLPKGWKLVGSPYDYPVYWRSFLFENGVQADNDVVRMWSYNPETETWREINKFEFVYPWTAYAVYNPIETDGEVAIDFYHSYGLNYYFTVPSAKEKLNLIDAKAQLTINEQELHFGLSSDASNSLDKNDQPLLPLSPEATSFPAHFLSDDFALTSDFKPNRFDQSITEWKIILPKGKNSILLNSLEGFDSSMNLILSGPTVYRSILLGEKIVLNLNEPTTLTLSMGTIEDLNTHLLPENPILLGNYPNPFNPSTTISFRLPNQSSVKIQLIDLTGKVIQTIINQPMEAGYNQVPFSASGLSSGIYFYRLETGNEKPLIGKMTLMK